MFFPIPKNLAGVRSVALLLALIRRWECLSGPEVKKWQRHRVGWSATDGRNGAERGAWETLVVIERYVYGPGDMDQGATSLVLHGAKAFERVSLTDFVCVGDALQFSQDNSACARWSLRAPTVGTV